MTFEEYLKDNWSALVEEAEEMTGERYDGQEPLLTKDKIIEIASEKFTSIRE